MRLKYIGLTLLPAVLLLLSTCGGMSGPAPATDFSGYALDSVRLTDFAPELLQPVDLGTTELEVTSILGSGGDVTPTAAGILLQSGPGELSYVIYGLRFNYPPAEQYDELWPEPLPEGADSYGCWLVGESELSGPLANVYIGESQFTGQRWFWGHTMALASGQIHYFPRAFFSGHDEAYLAIAVYDGAQLELQQLKLLWGPAHPVYLTTP